MFPAPNNSQLTDSIFNDPCKAGLVDLADHYLLKDKLHGSLVADRSGSVPIYTVEDNGLLYKDTILIQ